MQAVRKLAMVPPIRAFIPNWVSNTLFSGANAPIPPIWIPIDAKLANPQSAYVAINIDFG